MRKILLVIDDFKELRTLESFFRRIGFDVLSVGKEILVNDALLSFFPEIVIATAKGRAVDGLRLAAKIKKQMPNVRTLLIGPPGLSKHLPAEAQALVEGILEHPIQPHNMIRMVAQVAGLPETPLIEKYDRLVGTHSKVEEIKRSGGGEDKDPKQDGSTFVTGGQATARDPVVVKANSEPKKEIVGDEPSPNADLASSVPAASLAVEWDPIHHAGQAATARSKRSENYDSFLREHDEDVSGLLPRNQLHEAAKKLAKESESERQELEKLTEEKREFVRALFKKNESNE